MPKKPKSKPKLLDKLKPKQITKKYDKKKLGKNLVKLGISEVPGIGTLYGLHQAIKDSKKDVDEKKLKKKKL